MERQIIQYGYQKIEDILQEVKSRKVFIVHGHSLEKHRLYAELQRIQNRLDVVSTHFANYTSNPKIEEVQLGVEAFRSNQCDFIVAVGGGSALDVAKCIKQVVNEGKTQADSDYVKMLAIPTTAGTGSESTQFAVVYENGEKKSVDDPLILPDYVILEPELLEGLSVYQRKATMLDALCQAIESIWAKKATDKSRELAAEAIETILEYYRQYIDNKKIGNEKVLKAANLAGQAINITRTTAAHAMSYKITSLYSASHGHAVGACMKELWKWMLADEFDKKDTELAQAYSVITKAFQADNIQEAYKRYAELYDEMELCIEHNMTEDELEVLVASVNVQRLSNHPIGLTKDNLRELYQLVLV